MNSKCKCGSIDYVLKMTTFHTPSDSTTPNPKLELKCHSCGRVKININVVRVECNAEVED